MNLRGSFSRFLVFDVFGVGLHDRGQCGAGKRGRGGERD
jgi:hypothetical protein